MSRARAFDRFFPPFFYVCLAVVLTYPLAFHLVDRVILVRGSDAWLHLWDLWWVDKALVTLHANPYKTDFLYYPSGLNFYYHSLDLTNALLAIPLQRLVGLVTSFNLLIIANLALDGWAAYFLCRERTGSLLPSLVGGVLFASAPLMGTSVNLGQLDEVSCYWIPLYIIALWRLCDCSGPFWKKGGGRRSALAAGLLLAGSALATWYFTAGLIVFTVLFVPLHHVTFNRAYGLKALLSRGVAVAAALALFALVLSPLLFAMVRERLRGETYMLPAPGTTVFNSVDLASLVAPAWSESSLLNPHGSNTALGYTLLTLSAIGLVVRRRVQWHLTVPVAALVLFALGPQLHFSGVLTGLQLPYRLLDNVPFIGASRQPLRLLMTAFAPLSLLGAYGAMYVVQRLHSKRLAWLFCVPVLLLPVLETGGLPRSLQPASPEAPYLFLARDGTGGAVVEVPGEGWSALSLLHQTTHGRPVLGGYTSRHFPYPFSEGAPGAAQLLREDATPLLEEDILTPPPSETALRSLDHYDVRYTVVHKTDFRDGGHSALQQVLDLLYRPSDIAYEDAGTVIYRTPRAPDQSTVLVGLGSGWHRLERDPPHRWTGANGRDAGADIWVGVPDAAAGNYQLRMELYSYSTERTLSVRLDGRQVALEKLAVAPRTIRAPLSRLTAGDHLIRLVVAEPPVSPPGDKRLLGIGSSKIELVRISP